MVKTTSLTRYTLYKSLIIKESLNCTKALDKSKKTKTKKIHRDYGNVFKKCHERKKKTYCREGGERERNTQKYKRSKMSPS